MPSNFVKEPQAKPRRLAFLRDRWVANLIAAASILIGIMLAYPVFAQSTEVPAATGEATRAVIDDQLKAFQTGDHARAYSHAAPNITSYFSTLERFLNMVKNGYDPIYQPQEYFFGKNLDYNGEIYQEVFVTDRSGKQWQAVYTLRQQPDGTWKVTGVKLEPWRGAAA